MIEVFYWKSSKTLGIMNEGLIVYNYENKETEFIYKGAKFRVVLFGEIERDFSVYFDICFDRDRNAYGFVLKYQDNDCSRCKVEFKSFIRKGEKIKFNNVIIELVDIHGKVKECV